MRNIILASLFCLPFNSFAQKVLTDTFTIGRYIEVFHPDSIKIYFNCTGTIVDKNCAAFYRVGKLDKTIINIVGSFTDYFLDGKIAFRSSMHSNTLEGQGIYYYPNGQIKEKGNYTSNLRSGKWTYYYPDGKVEKVLAFGSEEPIVLEAYDVNGKVLVENGDGNFKTQFSNFKQCDGFETWGKVKGGKKAGDWQFANLGAGRVIATETYRDGMFVRGVSGNQSYSGDSKIHFARFYANESVFMIDNLIGCPGDFLSMPQYKKGLLMQAFYPELVREFSNYNQPLEDQWLIVGVKIGKDDKLENVNVASTINATLLESFIQTALLKKTKWKTLQLNGKKEETYLFFSILVDSGKLIIPAEYL
ncbi:MAG: hypothetical protein EOO46_22530, partial [Flavobacterium sp.]